jgi:hypothetical protein
VSIWRISRGLKHLLYTPEAPIRNAQDVTTKENAVCTRQQSGVEDGYRYDIPFFVVRGFLVEGTVLVACLF